MSLGLWENVKVVPLDSQGVIAVRDVGGRFREKVEYIVEHVSKVLLAGRSEFYTLAVMRDATTRIHVVCPYTPTSPIVPYSVYNVKAISGVFSACVVDVESVQSPPFKCVDVVEMLEWNFVKQLEQGALMRASGARMLTRIEGNERENKFDRVQSETRFEKYAGGDDENSDSSEEEEEAPPSPTMGHVMSIPRPVLPMPELHPAASVKIPVPAFTFHCNNQTQAECMKRCMFAGFKEVRVEIGSLIFLFNNDSKVLYGPFKATSLCHNKHKNPVLKGRFPFQVKVEGFGGNHVGLSFKTLKAIQGAHLELESLDGKNLMKFIKACVQHGWIQPDAAVKKMNDAIKAEHEAMVDAEWEMLKRMEEERVAKLSGARLEQTEERQTGRDEKTTNQVRHAKSERANCAFSAGRVARRARGERAARERFARASQNAIFASEECQSAPFASEGRQRALFVSKLRVSSSS